MHPPANHIQRRIILLLGIATLFCTGCVSRRATIRSNPSGALVLLDGEEIGYTPVSFDFTYYGTREVTLIKDGYERLTVMQKISAPWYQIPPLDFFSDNLLPGRITDRHEFSYELRPQQMVPTQDLLDRANSLRSESEVGP